MNPENKATVTGGVGGAAAVLLVIFGQQWEWFALTPEVAATVTAATTVLLSYAARFLPKPPAPKLPPG